MVTSGQPISLMTRFITSTGQGEPALIPVRRLERSYAAKSGRSNSAMNIVGTPYSDVHRSSCTFCNVAWASKEGAGITMQAP